MPWDKCEVNLNSDSTGSFYSGDIVTGSVSLHFKKDYKVNHIDFIVCGKCKADWTRPSPVMPYVKFYCQKRKIFYVNIDIFHELRGKLINAGVYNYSFHFALPHDLPSSFESSIGKICYWIKIRSYGIFNVTKVVPFIVFTNVNLNPIDYLLEPTYHEIHKMFWSTGTISLVIKTYTEFASKQRIPIEATISNERNVKISKLVVSLIQKTKYVVTEGYYDEEKTVCKVTKSKQFHNDVKESCHLVMDIPHLVPSTINTTDSMIIISYKLRVQMKFTYHLSLHEDVPVTVATIPVLHADFDKQILIED